MKFNLAEQLAVIKIVEQVIRADNLIYEGEAVFISQLASVLQFDPKLFKKAREVEEEQALAVLSEMPENKKHALAILLNEAASADGRVSERELQLIAGIFDNVGIRVERL
ncbi:hypothetical protein [Robiginitalea sediminis]|uniref:hypothetical protein n=1 Tax=Robiginitalea sediminis TaxID=1982593 RepID=UPI000B4BEBBC|nr:hypothetical protein [Robiginitalea sediminis]